MTAELSEDDISVKFITPALCSAGWDEHTQIRRQVSFTNGRIIVRGKLVARGRAKRVDFVLFYEHIPIALIEAKKASFSVGHGMQQALDYAASLDVPFVFSSNGQGFVFHDKTGQSATLETELALDAFPGPGALWARYQQWKGLTPEQERIVLQPYYDDGSGKEPRYYQRNAINATVEAIAKGRDRVLLVMATGTGKTYTAFQIIWRLWKSDWRPGKQKRVLFLADRNVLIDQTMVNDFRPFGQTMAKLSTNAAIERDDGTRIELTTAVDSKRRIDASYEIYLGLYQALTGPEERQKLFREFSPEFFDLIVIDECHRGGAKDESQWRGILEYFYNGFGIDDGNYSPEVLADNPELVERILRGELFTLGRHYIAASAMVEITPLWLLTPNVFLNASDGSLLAQLVSSYDVKQDIQILAALGLPVGSEGTEYGGIDSGIPGKPLSFGASLFVQLAVYF